MKAIISGISRLRNGTKTPLTATQFRDATRHRINKCLTLNAAPTIDRKRIQTVLSNFPSKLRLTVDDFEVLLFANQNRLVDYIRWPEDLKKKATIAKLRNRGFLERRYFPVTYNVTRAGYTMIKWLRSALEHNSPIPAKKA